MNHLPKGTVPFKIYFTLLQFETQQQKAVQAPCSQPMPPLVCPFLKSTLTASFWRMGDGHNHVHDALPLPGSRWWTSQQVHNRRFAPSCSWSKCRDWISDAKRPAWDLKQFNYYWKEIKFYYVYMFVFSLVMQLIFQISQVSLQVSTDATSKT